MPRSSRGRSRTPKHRPSTTEEGVAWLRGYALELFDKADGQGADWPVMAQTMFAAAFAMLDEARDHERVAKVLRRVEISLYDRLARNHDDSGPQPLAQAPPQAPKPLPPHRLPEPRSRP